MEKYNVYQLDVPHTATSGIEVGRFENIYTMKLLGDSLALGAGEVAVACSKVYHLEGRIFHHLRQAVNEAVKERKLALYIEDTSIVKPCDLEKITFHPTAQWWPNELREWSKPYTATCSRCFHSIYPDEKTLAGDRGYRYHECCPPTDEDGKFLEECIQTITGFVTTKAGTIRAVLYKDYKGVEHPVVISISDIRAHMSANPDQYIQHAAAFRVQSVSNEGRMNAAEFLGLVLEEVKSNGEVPTA